MRRTHLRRFANVLLWISGILIVLSFIAKEGFQIHFDLVLLPFFVALGLVGLAIILVLGVI